MFVIEHMLPVSGNVSVEIESSLVHIETILENLLSVKKQHIVDNALSDTYIFKSFYINITQDDFIHINDIPPVSKILTSCNKGVEGRLKGIYLFEFPFGI